MKNIKIAIVPTRRHLLNVDDAVESKDRLFEFIEKLEYSNVEFINIDNIVDNGILCESKDVKTVEKHLKDNEVDALFIPHCDFGQEEVVASVAKLMNKPVLIWGARDESPDSNTGLRKRDTQCGLFASTKVLMRYKVPFSYIVNCDIEDTNFIEGIDKFIRVVSVVNAFRKTRILQLSTRPKEFLSVMSNEAQLLEKFGIEIIPAVVPDLLRKIEYIKVNRKADIDNVINDLKSKMSLVNLSKDQLENIAGMRVALYEEIVENECQGAAIECWSMFSKALGVRPCLVVAELTDIGLPVACETDINGAITMIMLKNAGLSKRVPFFADLTMRHPNNDNAELLWHCGPFPYSLKAEGVNPSVSNRGSGQWQLKQGEVTIARFDFLEDEYSIFIGQAESTQGPKTEGTYLWVETNDWEAWEKKFIYGPYIHHVGVIYGKYADVLEEACRFIKYLSPDRV